MKRIILILLLGIMFISIASADIIPLSAGWNQFSIIGCNSTGYESTGDRNISLTYGNNLIGYSTYQNITQTDLKISLNDGTVLSYDDAVNQNYIQEQFRHWNNLSSTGQQGYELIPLEDSMVRNNQAYWVFWNSTTPANITVPNLGGGLTGSTIPFMNLTFNNGTAEMNITQAFSNGWIGTPGSNINTFIQYWDSTNGRFSNVLSSQSLSSWTGYTMWSRQSNVKMVVRNNETTCGEFIDYTITPPAGGDATTTGGSGGFGYINNLLPSINETENFIYYNDNLPNMETPDNFLYGGNDLNGYGYDNGLLSSLTLTFRRLFE